MGILHGEKGSKSSAALQQLPAPLRSTPTNGNVECYLKAPMTVVCKEYEQMNNGYGCKLEVPSMHFGLAAAGFPWIDPYDFKNKLLHLSNCLPLIVLQRDRGEGVVSLNSKGLPSISYNLSKPDAASMMTGMLGSLELFVTAGCDYASTSHNNDYGLDIEQEQAEVEDSADLLKNAKVRKYFREVESRGLDKHRIGVFSAHQMGSCRMGLRQEESAVDVDGQLWECDGLFVMDASVFPSASGANPMLTTYAISHMLSDRLAKRLSNEE